MDVSIHAPRAGSDLMHMLAAVAEFERSMIQDRTMAGLAVARSKGRVGGRPAKVFDRQRARDMRNQNPPMSWRAIACELGIPQSSIRQALSGVRKTSRQKPQNRAAG